MSNVISIHPYFKVKPGKLDAFKAALPAIVKAVSTEKKCAYFDFTINDDTVYCREAYFGADGVNEHVANVGPLLPTLFAVADLARIEVHGPAAELEKLKTGPLAGLKPVWFTHIDGVKR
ncbi:MAG: hypothetical protein FJ395_06465 [Verrucomicrobia bacterium]|nr:hypothetical protein [Verrucomicrobiota bacterium]